MGILEAGTILDWENNQKAREFVKHTGVDQFIHLYSLHKDRYDPSNILKWGEEIEFNMLEFDDTNNSVSVYTNSEVIHEQLSQLESAVSNYNNCVDQAGWHFEYGSYMIESVPGFPYSLSLNSLPSLQKSLSYRRWKLENILPPSVDGTTMTVFPALGSQHFKEAENETDPEQRMANSVFLNDKIVTNHSRFKFLTKNIYKRRGAKVSILVPVYKDKNTDSSPIWENSVEKELLNRFELQKKSEITPNPVKDYIYMDGMGFGMGMSCAQCTYMFSKVEDARYMYDQFAVLSPLWLAMTASTPFFRGMLAATDTRWDALSQSVDCRTKDEMKTIPKSRYSSVSLYISNDSSLVDHLDEYNDLDLPINQEAFDKIVSHGIDPIIAKHVAYMFIRDPFVVFNESLEEGNFFYYTHFENIQSTNWNSVRFKLPPSFTNPQSIIGWRVEFRTPELQMSDFENAAFISFITILVKVMLKYKLELYIPISKNDQNFKFSAMQNAVLSQKFWFRNDISAGTSDRSYKLMSLEEIMLTEVSNGKTKGLINICLDFLDYEYTNGNCSREARDTATQYLHFIELRVKGEVQTNATFFRNLIAAHPDYKQNSVIPPVVTYDICRLASQVGSLSMQVPELYGPFVNQFKPGFESCTPSNAVTKLLTHPSIETQSTLDSENDSTPCKAKDLQRYLFSLCHKSPNCNKMLPSLHLEKLESNFARITSFCLNDFPSGSDSFENSNTHNTDSISYKNSKEDPMIVSLRDFVINEDFTKSWMMRRWLATDYEPMTHYADDDDSFESQSESQSNINNFNSEKENDYFKVVNELSA